MTFLKILWDKAGMLLKKIFGGEKPSSTIKNIGNFKSINVDGVNSGNNNSIS